MVLPFENTDTNQALLSRFLRSTVVPIMSMSKLFGVHHLKIIMVTFEQYIGQKHDALLTCLHRDSNGL